MRILIDATMVREGGGVTYIRHILPALVRQDGNHEYHVLLSKRYQSKLIANLPDGIYAITPDLPAEPLFRRFWYLQTAVPRLLRGGGFDLLFSTAEFSPLHTPCPLVVAAHNLKLYAPLRVFPHIHQRLQLILRRLLRQPFVYRTLRRADRVVFVSEALRREVITQMRLNVEKTRVIYHGVSHAFFSAKGSNPGSSITNGQPYLLSVSTLAPHKNFESLLHAFARVVARDEGQGMHLVIAGSTTRNARLHQSLAMQAHTLGVSSRVHFMGRVEHDRLPPLYRDAAVFILSSRLESFGLPLVEAMASGVPVVASDLQVCREICRDAALYFLPDDPETLATHVLAVLREQAIAQTLSSRGLRYAQDFSWDNTARQLVQVFEEVMLEHHR